MKEKDYGGNKKNKSIFTQISFNIKTTTMKAKQLLLLLLSITVFSSLAKAQTYAVDTSIIRKYNSSLVNEVYDVIAKTNISAAKQKEIVNILKRQDSVLAVLIAQNSPYETIDSINQVYTKQWKAYLSTAEQMFYAVEKEKELAREKFTYAFISLALKHSGELELTQEQNDLITLYIDTLKIKEESFLNTNKEQGFNSYNLEKWKLNSVLSDNQMLQLLTIKNKERMKLRARQDWDEMVLRTLVTGDIDEEQTNQFVDFYIRKDYAYTRFEIKEYRNEYLHNLYKTEPPLLKKLYYNRKADDPNTAIPVSSFSQFMLAIQNKTQLGLTSTQIDSLGFFSDNLNNKKYDEAKADPTKKYDARAYESLHLNRILTNEQYRSLLIIKNTSKAKNFALNDWREIEQRGLAPNFSKDTSLIELTNFYIARECTYDRYEYDKVKQSTLISAIYANKPRVLNALVHARRNPGNNTIGQGYQW